MAIDASGIAALSLADKAAIFISGEEGFIAKPIWDVNAYRLGYGSDEITFADGTFRKVKQSDTTTKELARKDLSRRLNSQFIPRLRNQLGAATFDKLGWAALVGLLSLSYNYGSITHSSIITAARTLNVNELADTLVKATYNDNKSLPEKTREALRKRRQREADFIRLSKPAATASEASLGGSGLIGILLGVGIAAGLAMKPAKSE